MEFNPDKYNKVNGAQFRDAEELLQKIDKIQINRSCFILDIGCGSGNVTDLLANQFPQAKIISMDIDSKMVQFAENKYPNKNIKYIVADIGAQWNNLPLSLSSLESSFDIIWANRVLHWVDDKTTMGKNVFRLLKPGGTLYANITYIRNISQFLPTEFEMSNWRKIFKEMLNEIEQRKMWKDLITTGGFQSVDIEYIEKYWEAENSEELFNSLEFLWTLYKNKFMTSLVDELDDEKLRKLKDFCLRASLSKHGEKPLSCIDSKQTNVYYGMFLTIAKKV